jgi:hypothetical protein
MPGQSGSRVHANKTYNENDTHRVSPSMKAARLAFCIGKALRAWLASNMKRA